MISPSITYSSEFSQQPTCNYSRPRCSELADRKPNGQFYKVCSLHRRQRQKYRVENPVYKPKK